MEVEQLKFSIHNLILGNDFVEKDALANVKKNYTFAETDASSGIVECENEERYLWIYVRSGKNFPYSSEVLNTETKQCEKNPRDPNQAELRTQKFYLFSYETNQLYLHGGTEFLKRILNEINPQVKIRNLYKTRDEILESLKRVNKIRMVTCRDLFTWNQDLFHVPTNALGLGSPDQLKIEYKFSRVSVTHNFREYVKKKLFPGCDAGTLKSLVVAGEYEEGDNILQSTFNLKNLESSVVISASKDDRGMFDADQVKTSLLDRI